MEDCRVGQSAPADRGRPYLEQRRADHRLTEQGRWNRKEIERGGGPGRRTGGRGSGPSASLQAPAAGLEQENKLFPTAPGSPARLGKGRVGVCVAARFGPSRPRSGHGGIERWGTANAPSGVCALCGAMLCLLCRLESTEQQCPPYGVLPARTPRRHCRPSGPQRMPAVACKCKTEREQEQKGVQPVKGRGRRPPHSSSKQGSPARLLALGPLLWLLSPPPSPFPCLSSPAPVSRALAAPRRLAPRTPPGRLRLLPAQGKMGQFHLWRAADSGRPHAAPTSKFSVHCGVMQLPSGLGQSAPPPMMRCRWPPAVIRIPVSSPRARLLAKPRRRRGKGGTARLTV